MEINSFYLPTSGSWINDISDITKTLYLKNYSFLFDLQANAKKSEATP